MLSQRHRFAESSRGAGACAAALLAALSLTACGDKSTSSSSTAKPAGGGSTPSTTSASGSAKDPCTLLTKAEVNGALGGPSKPPKANESPSGGAVKVCSWFPAGGKLPIRFVQVSLSKFPGTSGRTQFDGLKKISPGAKDLTGIGDAAFAATGPGGKVTVLKGDLVVSVTSVDTTSATKLAKLVLGRT